jgi:malonyl-CoA decarboxylase
MLNEVRQAARRVGSQRRLRALLQACRRLLSERGEANSTAIARELLDAYGALDDVAGPHSSPIWQPTSTPTRRHCWPVPTPTRAHLAQARWRRCCCAAEPPRQELLRRLNRLPGGTARIVAMRHTLLGHLRALPELAAVEADFQHLLSSWFNPGFLQVRASTGTRRRSCSNS